MPELPEVECVKRNIEPYLLNKTIIIDKISDYKVIKSAKDDFTTNLNNQTVTQVDRIGKYVLIRCTNDHTLMIHLGMSGQLFVKTDYVPDKHLHFSVKISSGETLWFRDPRRFGLVEVFKTSQQAQQKRLALGPDALTITGTDFETRAKKANRPIKATLLDQRVLSGCGNIYADETLFASKITPQRKTAKVTTEEYKLIIENLQIILNKSIAAKGSSVTYKIAGDEHGGQFQNQLSVYGQKNGKCPICQNLIKKVVIGGRGTHYCELCQK